MYNLLQYSKLYNIHMIYILLSYTHKKTMIVINILNCNKCKQKRLFCQLYYPYTETNLNCTVGYYVN